MSVPRKHHYLPRAFLQNWEGDDGRLGVIDREAGKAWRQSAMNAARQNDFYTLETDEGRDLHIERALGDIESEAIPVIRKLLDSADCSPEDWQIIVMFLATLVMRTPARMAWVSNILSEVYEKTHHGVILSEGARRMFSPCNAKIVKTLYESGRFLLQPEQNEALLMVFSMLTPLVELLSQRDWTLLRVADAGTELVLSDDPVLLRWLRATPSLATESPGFGMPNTAVVVPLSSTTIAMGLWHQRPTQRRLSREQVAAWNGEQIANVQRFLFAKGELTAQRADGTEVSRRDVLNEWSMKT